MNAVKLSVIIPAYNTAEHLSDAIASLRSQSFSNWEAIVVDDGSTDSTGAVADALAREDGRIRVVHQTNGGVSVARNRGLDDVRGDLVAWLDADDAWAPGALARIVELARKNPEVHCFHFPYLERGVVAPDSDIVAPPLVLTGREAFDFLYVNRRTRGQHWQPWRFVYRADSLPRFRPGVIHEDVDVLPVHLASLGKVLLAFDPLYIYTPAREGAATASFSPRRVRDILGVMARNFGKGFDAMLAWNLYGYFLALTDFPTEEREALLTEFEKHPEWLMADDSPGIGARVKRGLIGLLGVRKALGLLSLVRRMKGGAR